MKNKKQSKTCIALIKNKRNRLIMAGDRRVSEDWDSSYECPYPKIKKKWNNILIGASGDSGLCKLIVDILEPEEIEVETDTYMYYKLVPAITKLLKNQPGYQDEHKLLRIATNEQCICLVGIEGRAYTINIHNPEDDQKEFNLGRVEVDDAPIPYVIGCGARHAYPILLEEFNRIGSNTKETLDKAMKAANDSSPGCGGEPDYVYAD